MNATLHASLLVMSLAAVAPAQMTHLVGPGGFPQIRDALAVAAPGDVINVLPGTYAHFEANVGVTIRALTIGTVQIEFDPVFAPGCVPGQCGATRITPPAGQVVHCIGLDFRPTYLSFSYHHRVEVAGGTATFDRCTLRSEMSALVVTAARVHMQDSSFANVGSILTGQVGYALRASGSSITAVRCSFSGTPATITVLVPAVLLLSSSVFQGSQLQVTGAVIGFGPGFGSAGIELDATSSAWISDSTITSGGTNACPVKANGGTGRLDRCVLSPTGTGCTNLPAGLVVGTDSTTPLQNGAPFTVDYRTTPNQIVAVFASPGLGHVPLPGITDQPVSIDVANHWLATALLSDATGFATVTWNMPPGLYVDTPIFVIGAGLTPTTFALSPPVGGVIR